MSRWKETHIWPYLLIVFKLDIKPTGSDHSSVFCSRVSQCVKTCGDTELFPFLCPAALGVFSLWFLLRSLKAFLSLTLASWWCVVCLWVGGVRSVLELEGWQMSSSDGLQLFGAVIADASGGKCFTSEWCNLSTLKSLPPWLTNPLNLLTLLYRLPFSLPLPLYLSRRLRLPKCFPLFSFMYYALLSSSSLTSFNPFAISVRPSAMLYYFYRQ